MDPRQVVARLLVVALAGLGTACSGPRPEVRHVVVVPSPQPGMVRVELDLANLGGGHGNVELDVTLRDLGAARTLVAAHDVELEAHQVVHVAIDIAGPPGQYEPAVSARYPD